MPRPPPPADAFTSTGRSASVTAARVESGRSTGTPAAAISCFASTLEPIASIAAGGGPIQTRPAAITARAKAAFSDRKP